jgi:CTP-dependent riboflavin kinase
VGHRELIGTVERGRGRAVGLLAGDQVLARLHDRFGLRVVPGTLNVRLATPFDPRLATSHVLASEIDPRWEEATGQAGYRLVPVTVAGRHRGVAFQADEPGYPPDLLEILCEVHLRSELGLSDGDPIAITIRE